MIKELNEDALIFSYRLFCNKFYKGKYIIEQKSESMIKTFFNSLNKHYKLHSLGPDFLWNYCVFQYNYWLDLKITSFDGRMKFSFIFGKKALDRYLNRNVEYDWQLARNRITIVEQLKRDFYKWFVIIEPKEPYFDVERVSKNMYYGTVDGLANCLLTTTLYHPLSDLCQQCTNKEECKELQRINYPKIYEQRAKHKANNS